MLEWRLSLPACGTVLKILLPSSTLCTRWLISLSRTVALLCYLQQCQSLLCAHIWSSLFATSSQHLFCHAKATALFWLLSAGCMTTSSRSSSATAMLPAHKLAHSLHHLSQGTCKECTYQEITPAEFINPHSNLQINAIRLMSHGLGTICRCTHLGGATMHLSWFLNR